VRLGAQPDRQVWIRLLAPVGRASSRAAQSSEGKAAVGKLDEIPNPKPQIPKKIPNSKIQYSQAVGHIGTWDLELLWDLKVGAWHLTPSHSPRSPDRNLAVGHFGGASVLAPSRAVALQRAGASRPAGSPTPPNCKTPDRASPGRSSFECLRTREFHSVALPRPLLTSPLRGNPQIPPGRELLGTGRPQSITNWLPMNGRRSRPGG
jgi:hypothetical protein